MSILHPEGWLGRAVVALMAAGCMAAAVQAWRIASVPDVGLPAEKALRRTEGRLSWMRCIRGRVEFTLAEAPAMLFFYEGKQGDLDGVCGALKQASGAVVVARHAPDPVDRVENVYGLEVAGRQVRPYASVSAAWLDHGRQGYFIAPLMLLMALFFLQRAFFARRRSD